LAAAQNDGNDPARGQPPGGGSVGGMTVRLARDRQLSERIAAVDEQARVGRRRHRDPPQGDLTGLRVATVEGADADGEDDVVRVFVSLERERFDAGLPDAQAPRLDQIGTTGSRLSDRGSGPIDRENVTGRSAAPRPRVRPRPARTRSR
jgi:hypothetical protein